MNFAQQHKDTILRLYNKENKSTYEIAQELNTYPNRIRRSLIELGVTLRDKSKAQKNALKSGRHTHPTKGKKHSQETKNKISESIYHYWEGLSDEDYEKRVESARDQWNNMTAEEKDRFHKAANEGMRKASKEGSKIERFVMESLRADGYQVVFHKKGLIMDNNLELDLFIPELKTAIEIDGPTHFFPIWGEASLKRHQSADAHKAGLLLRGGYILIRVKNIAKSLTNKHKRDLYKVLLEALEEIKKQFLAHFSDDLEQFIDSTAQAFFDYQKLDAASDLDNNRALVSGLVFSAISLHIISMRLFLTGYIIAAGNIQRQVIETIALAILCSCKSIDVLKRFLENSYSPNKSIRDALRYATKINVKKDSMKILKDSWNFYHKFSHPSKITIASHIRFSDEGGAIYIGSSFDEGKLDEYKKEMTGRVNLARIFPNFVRGIQANVDAWKAS